MLTNRPQTQITMRSILLLLLLLLPLTGCFSRRQSSSNNNGNEVMIPTPAPRPSFITRVIPSESESIPLNIYLAEVENALGVTDSLGVYNANVCVQLASSKLAFQGETFADLDAFLARNSLLVNGQQVEVHSRVFIGYSDESDDARTKFDFVEPPTICWHAPLDVGLHEAKYQFVSISGEIQSYTWYFLLTDEEG